MSAAASTPYTNGNSTHNTAPGFNNSTARPFPPLSSLIALSRTGYDPHSSIPSLLDTADTGLKQARTLVDFRRPDLAFVEFLRASEIVLNVVPRHRDYVHFCVDQPERATRLGVLGRRIAGETGRFEAIRGIINDDNLRTGVVERKEVEGVVGNGHGARVRPAPSPKPARLHGHAVGHTNSNVATGLAMANGSHPPSDQLSERFAKLRMPGVLDTTQRPDSRASNASSVHSSPISYTPSSTPDYGGRRSSLDTTNSLTRTTSNISRPQGPRGMPNGAPPKPYLLTNDLAMPAEPAATYSPARNMQTTGNIAPPRHSARSLASSNPSRRSSLLPASNGYHPHSTNPNMNPPPAPRRTSSTTYHRTISAEKLYDYLARFSILLIDFRPRAAFDSGHIYHRNVVCLEPLALRPGISAEEVQDTLVLSPESEQELWAARGTWDWVVVYDQKSEGEEQAGPGLRVLREALETFNEEKPLKRPPVLLVGGVEAWEDLAGRQALVVSETVRRVERERRVGGGGSGGLERRPGLRVQRKRVRDFNPLDEEEERSWRERARAESVVLPPTPGLSIPEGGEEGETGGNGEGVVDNEADAVIQAFNSRFPEANLLDDRQAFASLKPSRAPPDIPAKVPLYPASPAPSTYTPPQPPPPFPPTYATPPPAVPTRPQPAAPRMSYTGVSDRSSAARPTPTQQQMVPYIPSRFYSPPGNLRLPKTGLVNFGNTCYMNSILQALSATTPLSVFFLEEGWKAQLQAENWKVNSKGVLAELYANLVRNLWKGDVESLRPTTFRRFCGRLSEFWRSDGEQQDAKEFLDFLLDGLHEDLNTTWFRTPLRALTEGEEAKRERMPKSVVAKTEWGRYTHRDLSFVNSLFGGQHASKLTCKSCGFTSTVYEAFTSISVEIPTTGRGNGIPTLQDCLSSYCAEETLTRDDQWFCPHCKTTREASKRITLTRAPQFLCVHFKRFSTTSGGARKVRVPVDFPLHDLDLAPYMLASPSAAESADITATYGAEAGKLDASMTPPYLYDAYAVVRHIGGTMSSGHYVTAVKSSGSGVGGQGRWRLFNDTRVSEFEPARDGRGGGSFFLQSEEAYIVFYGRKVGMGIGAGKM